VLAAGAGDRALDSGSQSGLLELQVAAADTTTRMGGGGALRTARKGAQWHC
jgi:hypothetical protein